MSINQMPMKKWLLFLLVPLQTASSQNFSPIANGLYSGVHATKVNPAFTAYSHYIWHVNLIGAWANVNNNYLSLHLPYSAYRFANNSMPAQYKTEQGNPVWKDTWLVEHLNGKPKHAAVGVILYAPSFTMQLKHQWHIGLVTDATGLGRISGLSENLAHAFYKQLDTGKQAFSLFDVSPGGSNTIHRLAIQSQAWATAGINISKDIPLAWKNHLLAGITIKKAVGFGGFWLTSDKLVQRSINGDSVSLNGTNISFGSFSGPGQGMGADIGIGWVYHKPEYRQPGGYKEKHTEYLFKFGLSVLDIGSIRYQNADVTTIVNQNAIGWNLNNVNRNQIPSTPGADMFNALLNQIPNLRHTTQDVRIGLPTRLVLSADYQLRPSVFVNTQWVQSLRGRYSIHSRQQSYLAIAPRWERDFFEVSMPLALMYDYRAFRMGLAFRAGPLYIGSNSVMSLLYTKKVRDADIFVGIAFGNIPGKWQDRWLKRHNRKKTADKSEDCEKM